MSFFHELNPTKLHIFSESPECHSLFSFLFSDKGLLKRKEGYEKNNKFFFRLLTENDKGGMDVRCTGLPGTMWQGKYANDR